LTGGLRWRQGLDQRCELNRVGVRMNLLGGRKPQRISVAGLQSKSQELTITPVEALEASGWET
jgi:hypothetical protein